MTGVKVSKVVLLHLCFSNLIGHTVLLTGFLIDGIFGFSLTYDL